MSKTRNNHYVPEWYQEGFIEAGANTLAYLDLKPPEKVLGDGRVITERALFRAPKSRAFKQRDLYSTFFGTSVNDEIERRLFGDIDTRGANAIRAFAGVDVGEWHRNFQTLFEYIDVQKIRTPKGLDWLNAQYPALTQNELMLEMQGIRTVHCTIWSEGVREIVSAEDSDVKFIISDHPVTIYNHAAAPDGKLCEYPNDPAIAFKGSQTVFPLNRDFCLIFTNLEYARDSSTDPLDKRTFARNYRRSMVRTDAFIRTRKLSDQEVTQINYIIKARARRYLAAGRKEWLYPEESVSDSWEELRDTLLPKDELWRFGGELYAKFDDGHVYYQDEFGRTEQQRDFLKKEPPSEPLRPRDFCGCGSGLSFRECCEPKPVELRPAWNEPSIRERNFMLLNGIVNVLELDPKKDWNQVRRDLVDDQISLIYRLYEGLWPLETDLLALLPKPDGTARAVYTGCIHPAAITEFALSASLYFGPLLIQHPFVHAGTIKKDFSPVENPRSYRHEFLKTVFLFLSVMPMVEAGLINLIPDPCDFDFHLRDQMLDMAKFRSADNRHRSDAQVRRLMEQDVERNFRSLPRKVLRSQIEKALPDLDETKVEETLRHFEQLRQDDPLADLQEDTMVARRTRGHLSLVKLLPNFEMSMYLAQATGSSIITDNLFRWNEIRAAIRLGRERAALESLANNIEGSPIAFPQAALDVEGFATQKPFASYPEVMRGAFKYLSNLGVRERKPNFEARLAARFARTHASAQALLEKARIPLRKAKISCLFPPGGVQDNTVNRLLLMSSSERHLQNVPMAFFIEEYTAN